MIDFRKAELFAKHIVVSPRLADDNSMVNLAQAYLALSKQGLDDYHRGYEEGKASALQERDRYGRVIRP